LGGGRFVGEFHEVALELHADAERAKVLGRIDRNAAVAGAEVDDNVVLGGVGELEQAPDHALGRRHPDRVAAHLADLWCLRENRSANQPNQNGEASYSHSMVAGGLEEMS
jgi:hypothetical protein